MKISLVCAAAMILAIRPARSQTAPIPIRELASLAGVDIGELSWLPNGRIVLYTTNDSLYAYDLMRHATTPVAQGDFSDIVISPLGNRIAFVRLPDGAQRPTAGQDPPIYVWSMPVDSATGTARGAPQRVSFVSGTDPVFADNGSTIVFAAFRPGHRQDLLAVPATGGPERTIATFDSYVTPFPATDGKSVFAISRADHPQRVQQVDVASGNRTPIPWLPPDPRPLVTDEHIGFAFSPTRHRLNYATATGERGSIPVSAGYDYIYWDGLPQRNGRALIVEQTSAASVRLVNLRTGASRSLSGKIPAQNPSFAADGQVAYQTILNAGSGIVVNGPGSESRRFVIAGGVNPSPMRWSPDSKVILFLGPARATLNVLDVNSGRVRLIDSSSAGIGHFIWRDAHTVTYARHAADGAWSFYDASLDGKRHKLRDLPSDVPHDGFMFFVSPDAMAIGAPNGGVIFPMHPGIARKLPPGSAVRAVPSDDGRWILALQTGPQGKASRLLLVSTVSDSTRTLDLPFEVRYGPGPGAPYARLTGNADHALMLGTFAGDSVVHLFSVPMDGGRPTSLATLPPATTQFDPSPDGATIAIDVEATAASVIREVDLSRVLSSSGGKRK